LIEVIVTKEIFGSSFFALEKLSTNSLDKDNVVKVNDFEYVARVAI